MIEPETDWQTFVPDPYFRKLAIATQEGELVLKELETGKEAICKLKLDSFHMKEQDRLSSFLRSMQLDWAQSGNDFVCRIGTGGTFLSNAENKQGNELVELAKLKLMTVSYTHLTLPTKA